MYHIWLQSSKNALHAELRQCDEEGTDISALRARFDELLGAENEDDAWRARADELLDEVSELSASAEAEGSEPSELRPIRALRPASRWKTPRPLPGRDVVSDHILGAWQGRCAGCLLGKPFEGWRKEQIEGFCAETGQWPLRGFVSAGAATDDMSERYPISDRPFIDRVDHMVSDDDTNYTAAGLLIYERHGRVFTPGNVAEFWMQYLPVLHVCTAERAAYRNFVCGVDPPRSARLRNPYREWIGAQIRADFWGYVCPGDPATAAEFAWRDASISHVKNGVYGEMWVAAMLAAAAVEGDLRAVVEAGLGEIPRGSRLASEVREVVALADGGAGPDELMARVHARWDEGVGHDWCHTISNASIVAAALLTCGGDFARAVTTAVAPGFDTDCNGATVGSIMGMLLGASIMPPEWAKPLNDRLSTDIRGANEVRITDMAIRTVNLALS